MGLVKNITLNNGLNINDAYFKVIQVNGNTEIMDISLGCYINRDSFLDGKAPLHIESYTFIHETSDNAMNVIRQAYGYLKRTDDFIEAGDVLEEGQEPIMNKMTSTTPTKKVY